MSILDELAAYAKVRVEEDKKSIPLNEIKKLAAERPVPPSFYEAIKKQFTSYVSCLFTKHINYCGYSVKKCNIT